MKAHLKLAAAKLFAFCLLLGALAVVCPHAAMAQGIGGESAGQQTAAPHPAPGDPQYGIAFKRPVLQAACRFCPWGALGDAIKQAMAPYGYDVAICYSCSGADSVPIVSKKLVSPEITDRQGGEGTNVQPEARIDFGTTQMSNVRDGYDGTGNYQKTGPFKNLRAIARIGGMASYLMVAATRESGITDLSQIAEKKMPVRVLGGNDQILAYYGLTRKDIISWGGKFLDGTALRKNANFDVIMGNASLANNPEGNMWYEMTQKRDLTFLSLPEGLRDQLVKDGHSVKVNLPFRYMRGVGDYPIASVSNPEDYVVYGDDDLPDAFVRDVAKALDEQRGALRYTNMAFYYDSGMVWDTGDVPLHPAAAAYYRERGYLPPESKNSKKK